MRALWLAPLTAILACALGISAHACFGRAVGYVKELDTSLNNIRIVTGKSSDEMERFAKEANNAAKALSTSTLEYSNAALIYYQQGLNEEAVQRRTDVTVKAANVTGKSQFDITNGNFDGSFDSTKGFKVDVVNGNVNRKLGTSFKGEITANVVNGRVKHEGLTFSAVDEDKKSLKGYIGNRDWDVNLEVVNGRINLEGRQ